MDNATVIERLQAEFGDKIGPVSSMLSGEATINVPRALAYNFLENLCGVDYLGRQPRFEVVYHLLSHANRHRVCLKVGITEKDIHVPTLTGLWQTANYQEREAYDMFGIIFDGHPALERILMPDDWSGFPQRKDVPLGYEEVAFSNTEAQISARKPFAEE